MAARSRATRRCCPACCACSPRSATASRRSCWPSTARRLLEAVDADWAALLERLQLDPAEAFGEPPARGRHARPHVLERLASWAAQPAALAAWLGYGAQKRQTSALGLSGLAYQLHQGGLPAARALDAFDQAYYEAQLRQAFEAEPALAAFAGPEQEQLVERFQRARPRAHPARPARGRGRPSRRLPQRGGEIGQLGLLEREFAKKRRHLPIRQLLARAGQPIQAIKPVLMMSPLSVAEFLAPGALRFDLLVIDEASQVEPVDAFGALARGTQLVVVGDQRQLPPSPFFKAGAATTTAMRGRRGAAADGAISRASSAPAPPPACPSACCAGTTARAIRA